MDGNSFPLKKFTFGVLNNMTSLQIVNLIQETKERYLNEVKHARARLKKHEEDLTAQQISTEVIFIADMESRAYAMTLLLEEITDEVNQ